MGQNPGTIGGTGLLKTIDMLGDTIAGLQAQNAQQQAIIQNQQDQIAKLKEPTDHPPEAVPSPVG